MQKLLMLRGLPASGKSTASKEMASKAGWVSVNKDTLREMLHGGKWSRGNEKEILNVRDAIIRTALAAGKNVVVDDTNFAPKHEQVLRGKADEFKASFDIRNFETPIEECIRRDLKRPNSVGEKVIRQMYKDYLAPKVEPIRQDPALPMAVICDLDGTLALMGDRNPYDASTCDKDAINEPVALAVRFCTVGNDVPQAHKPKLILVSGREDKYRDQTLVWLEKHGIEYDDLLMRSTGDNRKDNIVKKELYEKNIMDRFNVLFVFDDRNRVVEMWRSLGLTVMQVADGDF